MTSARERALARVAQLDSSHADEQIAVAAEIADTLASGDLQAVDHDDLFAGVPAIRDHVVNTSARLGLPTTTASLLALSLLSIGCADRVRVRIDEPDRAEPWCPPLHLWTLGELASGEGKSELLRAMGQPAVSRFARRLHDAWSGVVALDEDRREQANRRLRSNDEAERLAARAVCNAPQLRAPSPALDVVTPEEFGWRTLQSGFTWIVTAEGRDFFDGFVFGRETAAISELLKGFSGDTGSRATRGDTDKNNRPLFDEYHAVVTLVCQPGNLSPSNPAHKARLMEAAGRGLLARFIVGRAGGEAPAKGGRSRDEIRQAEAAYSALLERFLVVHTAKPSDGFRTHPCAPRSPEGEFVGQYVDIRGPVADALLAFQAGQKEAAKAYRSDDERDPRAALLARAGEVAIRVAALLALARAGGLPALQDGVEVTLEEAERAIRLVERVHVPHGLALVEQTTAGEVETLSTKVLTKLAELDKEVTRAVFESAHAKRWQEVRGRAFRDKDPLRLVFENLVERRLVVARETGRSTFYKLSPAGLMKARAHKEAA